MTNLVRTEQNRTSSRGCASRIQLQTPKAGGQAAGFCTLIQQFQSPLRSIIHHKPPTKSEGSGEKEPLFSSGCLIFFFLSFLLTPWNSGLKLYCTKAAVSLAQRGGSFSTGTQHSPASIHGTCALSELPM